MHFDNHRAVLPFRLIAHFAPVLYAHFTPESGAQFDRIFHNHLSRISEKRNGKL